MPTPQSSKTNPFEGTAAALFPPQLLDLLTKPISVKHMHQTHLAHMAQTSRCSAVGAEIHTPEKGQRPHEDWILGDESSGGRGDKAWHDVNGLTHVCGPLGCRRPPAARAPPRRAGAGSHAPRTAARTSGSNTWEEHIRGSVTWEGGRSRPAQGFEATPISYPRPS